jgi:hypothetical protein
MKHNRHYAWRIRRTCGMSVWPTPVIDTPNALPICDSPRMGVAAVIDQSCT